APHRRPCRCTPLPRVHVPAPEAASTSPPHRPRGLLTPTPDRPPTPPPRPDSGIPGARFVPGTRGRLDPAPTPSTSPRRHLPTSGAAHAASPPPEAAPAARLAAPG